MGEIYLERVFLLLIAAINSITATYVLLRNPRHLINRSFFLFVIGAALWVFGIVFLSWNGNFFFDKVILWGGALTVFGLLVFASVFPDKKTLKRSFWFNLVPFAVIAALVPKNVFIARTIIHSDGGLEPVNGPLFPFYAGVLGIYIFWSLFFLARTYRRVSSVARLQMQYFFLGTAAFFLSAFLFDALLPAIGIFGLNLLGPLASVLFAGCTAYAIVRHELMDIRVVIQRSAIYTFLAAVVIAFYLAAVSGIGYVFHQSSPETSFAAAALTILVGIFGTPRIEKYFRRITDRFFFKDRYSYSGAMHELSEVLTHNLDLADLVSELSRAVRRIFKISRTDIFLTASATTKGTPLPNPIEQELPKEALLFLAAGFEPILRLDGEISASAPREAKEGLEQLRSFMKSRNVELLAPMGLDGKLLGIICLGAKKSEDPFTSDDVALFRTIANQAGIAFKKAELYERVRRHSEELEERVRERTSELKKLQEDQRQTMVDLSHALQTPLTVLRSGLEAVKQRRSKIHAAALEKSVDEISKFIYDMLRLARLETAKDALEHKSVDLSQLVGDVAEYVGVVCRERHIVLERHIEPKIRVMGDRKRLEEAITNLLSNSVKYMKMRGEKKISVVLKRKDQNAILSIEDTGVGIKAADLPNIFTRFYRVRNTDRIGADGAGLGLAIAKKIVERHGGTIKAKSTPRKGTTFTATLPVA